MQPTGFSMHSQLMKEFELTTLWKRFLTLSEQSTNNQKPFIVKGAIGSLLSVILSRYRVKTPNQRLFLLAPKDSIAKYQHDFTILSDSIRVAVCSPEPIKKNRNNAQQNQRTAMLHSLTIMQTSEQSNIISSADAFTLQLPESTTLVNFIKRFEQGQVIEYTEFYQDFLLNGFERKDYVSNAGEIAIRGGIIDIFPLGLPLPLRIEFWGNSIESIREFDPLNQRSIREYKSIEFLCTYFHSDNATYTSTLHDYLRHDDLLIIDEPDVVFAEFTALGIEDIYQDILAKAAILVNPLQHSQPKENVLTINATKQNIYDSSIEKLYKDLHFYFENSFSVYIEAEGTVNSKRLHELIESISERYEQEQIDEYYVPIEKIRYVNSTLHEGFTLPEDKLALLTEHQIFNRSRWNSSKQTPSFSSITLRELQQLRKGDYLVHIDKGIGKFDGLETISIGNSKQESVRIIFDAGDILYVNLAYINKIQRYSSGDMMPPKLSKLGSSEWERKKQKTKKKIKDIARDLIQLYAKRKEKAGTAFPADTIWQKEFEASFMYEDTPDQERATAELKHDMQDPTPMDRLVCGDVGFGKTEVAIRAAFKAAQAGFQVAVLVPTTILARQHHITFSERLQKYPVKVDVVSRFRTTQELQGVAENVANGNIDILIGTHRILSKDIQFKNIGLLIIDEEQRFGVGAKEKLRVLRETIDTLTLTATPIPRTLNFSLMGARDLSIMETPPRNRLPVETMVSMWDNDTLVEAIGRELSRGGQIYFVNDTIQDLDAIASRLLEIYPGVTFGIAHGQMDSSKLEITMERFMERKFDILLTTKIVESGLDIPNVNTIIINRADKFGLAELYQLRGRVGRSNTQAYCYLLVPPVNTLNQTALRRLQAIEEHTDLGSGFKLAMRDLEIRGAGNLLGGEQSGFIVDMGIELYQKILDEAVSELRNEEFSSVFGQQQQKNYHNDDISIELDVDALLPESYIRKDTERYEIYKQLFHVNKRTSIVDSISELRDRYGAIPQEVDNLFLVAEIRYLLKPLGFERVIITHSSMRIELPLKSAPEYYQNIIPILSAAIKDIPKAHFLQIKKKTVLDIPLHYREESRLIAELLSNEYYAQINQSIQSYPTTTHE